MENCLQSSQKKSSCGKTRQLLSELLHSERGGHCGAPPLKAGGSSTAIPAKALGHCVIPHQQRIQRLWTWTVLLCSSFEPFQLFYLNFLHKQHYCSTYFNQQDWHMAMTCASKCGIQSCCQMQSTFCLDSEINNKFTIEPSDLVEFC